MTQSIKQLLRALSHEMKTNPNCSFELSTDQQKIRRRSMIVEPMPDAEEVIDLSENTGLMTQPAEAILQE